jgi:crotonobetainyl-CoA:carnitine CoA-transferase CaiB-like acyl-CoA transferase
MVRMIAGMPLVGAPVRLDGSRADSDLPPPRLGEHTRQVLNGIGLELPEFERLKAEGIIA